MTFYSPNEPILSVESFSELKGTKMLEKVENSVFWLDVLGYNTEIMTTFAKVCFTSLRFVRFFLFSFFFFFFLCTGRTCSFFTLALVRRFLESIP